MIKNKYLVSPLQNETIIFNLALSNVNIFVLEMYVNLWIFNYIMPHQHIVVIINVISQLSKYSNIY